MKKINKCPYLLSSETTVKGMGLEKLAGKEDPVESGTVRRHERCSISGRWQHCR